MRDYGELRAGHIRGSLDLRITALENWRRKMQLSPSSSSTISEGPGIDILSSAIGLGGDTILLYDSAGSPTAEYAASDAGLISALAAAASGQVLVLPICSISGDHTVPAGVTLTGMSMRKSVLTGKLTLGGNGAGVENLSIVRTAADANNLLGLSIAGNYTALWAINVYVTCTQAGSGDAYAISADGDCYLRAWTCYLEGTSAAGDGYAVWRDLADDGVIVVTGGRAYGSTTPYNE